MKYCFYLLTVLFLIGCQSEQKSSERLFADLFVRFLETERQIKAHASFYEGDDMATAQSVTFPNEVTFQRYKMQPRQIENRTMRYVFNGTGSYDGSFVFRYTDRQRKQREHRIVMSPIIDFAPLGDISRSRGMLLRVDSEPLQNGESIVLLFTSEENHSGVAEFRGPRDVTQLEVPASFLQEVVPGKNYFYLVKKQRNKVEGNDINVTSNIELYSKTIVVEVLE
ncbi:MAG TPA: hypothetical protein PKC76_06235 [Saprospiraceae bacterium]|nr:hypothetical protein [Saprospiraceae bacterium]HMP23710.1 hypothetical protein [Saprospiraceae bacterium]